MGTGDFPAETIERVSQLQPPDEMYEPERVVDSLLQWLAPPVSKSDHVAILTFLQRFGFIGVTYDEKKCRKLAWVPRAVLAQVTLDAFLTRCFDCDDQPAQNINL